jgi:hypothetical protein
MLTKNFAPQVEVLEVHGFLKRVESKFELEALINVKGSVGCHS